MKLKNIQITDPMLHQELIDFCLDLNKQNFPEATLILGDRKFNVANIEKIKEKLIQNKKDKTAKKRLKDAENIILSLQKLRGVEHREDPRKTDKEVARPRSFTRSERLLIPDSVRESRKNPFYIDDLKRIIAKQGLLDIKASREILIAGAKGALERTLVKTPKEYDAVVLMCSDSRCEATSLRHYEGKHIATVQIAGNAVTDEVRAVIDKLKENGEIFVIGHIGCGACLVKKDEHKHRGKSQSIDRLLDRIHIKGSGHPNIFINNTEYQREVLANLDIVRERKIKVYAGVIGFNTTDLGLTYSKTRELSDFVSETTSEVRIAIMHAKIAGKTFAEQYAHAIILSDPKDLGNVTNGRTFFGADLNELFAVSLKNAELSEEALGSIEYALASVNCVKSTGHIVIVHSDPEVLNFLKQVLCQNPAIKKATKNGATVSLMQLDKENKEIRLI
ncbi:MAG: carbonic anhydrase [Candidatus Micrarchaeota archaeon]